MISDGVRKEEIARCCVVYVSSVQALDDKRARVPKVLAHFERFLIDVLRCEVLSDAAVVRVGKLRAIKSIIEQVVNVDVVDVPLDFVHVNVVLLPVATLVILRVALLAVVAAALVSVVVCVFQPRVGQNLRHSQPLLRL